MKVDSHVTPEESDSANDLYRYGHSQPFQRQMVPSSMPTTTRDRLTPAGNLANVMVACLAEFIGEIVSYKIAELKGSAGGAESTPRCRWMTPPKAARATGISAKTIRRMVHDQVVASRLRNGAPNPRQAKFLVNVDEVAAAAERRERPAARSMSLAERASRIRSKSEGR